MNAVFSYTPEFLCSELSMTAFEALIEDLDWERRETAPRSEYWVNTFNQSYTYGRGKGVRTYFPRTTHPAIEAVTDLLENQLAFRYEGCFLNRYDNEREGLGWHADDDPSINHERPIAVVTLGQAREIQLKQQASNEQLPLRVMLEPGSLFLMNAGVQQTHFHRIPKAPTKIGTRISLTYRSLIQRDGHRQREATAPKDEGRL